MLKKSVEIECILQAVCCVPITRDGRPYLIYMAYKAKAANPANAAPTLTIIAAAPPVYGAIVEDGDGPEPPVVVAFGFVVIIPGFPATRVKFAHVSRVLLLVWTTMDRLPKNEPGPFWVER